MNTNDPIIHEISPTASESGFHWVAEWERHEATWIAWPHNLDTWPNRFDNIPKTFERMVRTLAEVEKVHLLAGTSVAGEQARLMLEGCDQVVVHDIPTNDCWIRDFGPTFVLNSDHTQIAAVHWRYNAWGGKYPPFDDDASNGKRMAESIGCRLFASNLVCEGGGIETDGNGTLLTTSSCLLSMSRNPDRNRSQVEAELISQLGIRKVVWIDGGALAGDDTDSHIDQLVRFVRPGLVVAAISFTSDDENAMKLEKQMSALKNATDADERRFDIVPLRTPPPRYIQGRRVPESYCNFYIANDIVMVPLFGFRETDEEAVQVLRDLFPDRTIVPIDASDLIWGNGAFHCATQQQPAIQRM